MRGERRRSWTRFPVRQTPRRSGAEVVSTESGRDGADAFGSNIVLLCHGVSMELELLLDDRESAIRSQPCTL